jgi:hypothetical protein
MSRHVISKYTLVSDNVVFFRYCVRMSRYEGFRIVALRPGQVCRLSRHWGQVFVPKAGWVRFRWSRAVPPAKSFRVTLDRAGRWHIALTAVPAPIDGPGTGEAVGVDRGVVVSAAPLAKCLFARGCPPHGSEGLSVFSANLRGPGVVVTVALR